MNQQVFCTQCGTANTAGANFCVACGARLAPPAAPPQAPPPPTQAPQAAPPSGYQAAPPTSGYQAPPQAPPQAPMQQSQGAFQTPAGIEKEPMLLLDITGSMNYGTSANDPTPRRETIKEAINIIVGELAAHDSQAAHEEGGGGLRTVVFSGGHAADIGDLNPGNLNQVWSRIQWAGGTRIMPGWTTLLNTFMGEFGNEPPESRPMLMALVITDGEADDTGPFAQAVAQAAGGVYVVLAIIGYGPDHDAALRAYQDIEKGNANVKVVPFGSETDPEVIARALIRMIE